MKTESAYHKDVLHLCTCKTCHRRSPSSGIFVTSGVLNARDAGRERKMALSTRSSKE